MQNSSDSYEFDVNLNMKVLYSKVSHSYSLSCEIFFEYLNKKNTGSKNENCLGGYLVYLCVL